MAINLNPHLNPNYTEFHQYTGEEVLLYGGDFGYSVDPAVLVRIYRKANEYWVTLSLFRLAQSGTKLCYTWIEKYIQTFFRKDLW